MSHLTPCSLLMCDQWTARSQVTHLLASTTMFSSRCRWQPTVYRVRTVFQSGGVKTCWYTKRKRAMRVHCSSCNGIDAKVPTHKQTSPPLIGSCLSLSSMSFLCTRQSMGVYVLAWYRSGSNSSRTWSHLNRFSDRALRIPRGRIGVPQGQVGVK